MTELIIPAIISCVVAFFTVFFSTPYLIKFLQKRNLAVKDMNKKDHIMIVRPGGPSIIAGIITSELILYGFLQLNEILAIIITSFIAFVIGYVDDRKVMGGWFKPIALILASTPIIFLGAYDSNLSFPLFGTVQIPALYLLSLIHI